MSYTELANFIWPLCFILVLLFVLRRMQDDINPILRNVVGGLSMDASKNAKSYAIALAFGLSASLSAFIDVFKELDAASVSALGWHQYATLWAKVANPFIVAILAYATQSNFTRPPTGTTNPPFPVQPNPPP